MYFDVKLATNHSIDEAIFLQNLYYWIKKNKANNKHFHDGKYWTYNSKSAYLELFPFWSYAQIKLIIKKLDEKGLILIDNFNENTWDKTLWYSLSDDLMNYFEMLENPSVYALANSSQSIGQKKPIDWSEKANRLAKNDHSYIGANINTNINTNRESTLDYFKNDCLSLWEAFQMKYKSQISDFKHFEKVLGLKLEEEGLEWNAKKINARIERFAINFIQNEKKAPKPYNESKPAYMLIKAK